MSAETASAYPDSKPLSARKLGVVGQNVVALVLMLAALWFGWQIRDEYIISAEDGLGYLLGILGGSFMLLLLIYPVRKRKPRSRWFIFSTPAWFKIHMALGLIGPLLILYHCNFSLGSTNSNVALGSMLLMASSGLVGRYIYTRIHAGLYGKRLQMRDLLAHKAALQVDLAALGEVNAATLDEAFFAQLDAFEGRLRSVGGLRQSFARMLGLGRSTRRFQQELMTLVDGRLLDQVEWQSLSVGERDARFATLNTQIGRYLGLVRQIADLAFFERVFAYWHMLHMPIFFMLIIAGFVHVYAVHAY